MSAVAESPDFRGLAWSSDLALGQPQMDRTHEEFVGLLNEVASALRDSPEAALAAFDALLAHTVGHFGQEERWMAQCGFAAGNCHAYQHAQVLEVMREVLRFARAEGLFEPLRVAVHELALWFPAHARMMDAALAETPHAAGFDPASGACATPAGGAAPITGCGSKGCAT